jgi:hypothetical protein
MSFVPNGHIRLIMSKNSILINRAERELNHRCIKTAAKTRKGIHDPTKPKEKSSCIKTPWTILRPIYTVYTQFILIPS